MCVGRVPSAGSAPLWPRKERLALSFALSRASHVADAARMRCGGGTASVEARRRTHIAVLTISSMVCGGMVAAIGPSIDSFAYATGLDQASIGLAIMHNRIAKLVGLGLWTVYANALQRGGGFGLRPRTLMAGCMLLTSLLSLAIAHIHWSHLVLRASLAAFGMCYGIVDSASLQLAIWSSDSIEKSRLSVATVSARSPPPHLTPTRPWPWP